MSLRNLLVRRSSSKDGVLVATHQRRGADALQPPAAFDAERLRLSAAATDSLLVDTGRLLPLGGYRLSLLVNCERSILGYEGFKTFHLTHARPESPRRCKVESRRS